MQSQQSKILTPSGRVGYELSSPRWVQMTENSGTICVSLVSTTGTASSIKRPIGSLWSQISLKEGRRVPDNNPVLLSCEGLWSDAGWGWGRGCEGNRHIAILTITTSRRASG